MAKPAMRSNVMAEKLGKALHIEKPKPFIHPNSRRSVQEKIANAQASAVETRATVVAEAPPPPPPPTPPPTPIQVEPPRQRRHPMLEHSSSLRNSAKDRRNILATELEGYRKQETRLQADLAQVQQFIKVRVEECNAINESLDNLDLFELEAAKLVEHLSKHGQKAHPHPHHAAPSAATPTGRSGTYYHKTSETLSSSDVLEYMKMQPGKDVTLKECRDFFNITDPQDVRCRDLAIRFNYLMSQGSVVRIAHATYRLAPTQ